MTAEEMSSDVSSDQVFEGCSPDTFCFNQNPDGKNY